MKRLIKYNLLLILPVLLFLSWDHPGIAEELKLQSDLWAPFCGNPESEKPGYVIEIAKAILAKKSIPLVYQLSPWNRVIAATQSGDVDAAGCASKGDIPTAIFPDEPLGIVTYSIFSLKDYDFTYTGIDSLKNQTLDVITNYSYGPTLDAYIEENKRNSARIQFVYGDEAGRVGIEKLVRGRSHLFAQNKEVFFTDADKLKMAHEQFKEVGIMPEHDPLYIAFAPNKKSSGYYAQVFSEGISELRRSGELKKILTRYGIQDWKK